MKKKLLIALAALTAVVTAFTLFGYFYTRGLRVYLLSTKTGGFFAAAWQYTALIAAVLWIVLAAVGISRLIKARKAAPKGIAAGAGVATEVAGKRKTGEKIPPKAAAKIPPKAAPRDAGGKIPPKGPAMEGRPVSGAAVVAGARKRTDGLFDAGGDTGATALMDNDAEKGGTEPMLEEARREEPERTELVTSAPADDGAKAEAAAPIASGSGETLRPAPAAAPKEEDGPRPKIPGDRYCTKCGTKVTGKNFCPNCGTKVGS